MIVAAGHGASVRIEACGKTFADGTRALEPATLDIARGETLVLLGPSGCGKTTMLRIIAGLELPDTDGKVLFDGKDMTSVPIEKRNVGMVFQSYALFPNMTVADNIGYGLKIRGVSQQERTSRIAELVALTNITGLENRRINQLSGGQRQRVARPSARRTQPGAPRARHHHNLCHARSVRGDGTRRPRCGDAEGRDCPNRHAARDLL
jgi:putative spermidine/putrescine transport system ATP-binding protein